MAGFRGFETLDVSMISMISMLIKWWLNGVGAWFYMWDSMMIGERHDKQTVQQATFAT